jgi:hypothetical protein
VTALLVGLPGGVSQSAPATRRSVDALKGPYKAQVRGALRGAGQVVVSAQHVHFNNIPVEDGAGARGVLNVRATLAGDGRFKGTGQALGRAIALSGRLEMPDATVKIGRLVCSFSLVGAGEFGRVIGEKEAQAPQGGSGGGGAQVD